MDGNSKSFGYLFQRGVSSPQLRSRRQKAGSNEMRVSQADAFRVKGAGLNHVPHFAELRHVHLEKRFHILELLSPVLQ